MTGRAAGFCAGFGAAGFANPAAARGGGCGRGRGMGGRGRGFRNMFYATGLPAWARAGGDASAADEKQALSSQAQALRAQLDGIEKRLEQL